MNNQIAEYALLGCILKENHLIEDPNHREEYFSGQLRVMYRVMKELNSENKPLDMVSMLTKQMKSDFGGVAAITEAQNRSNVKKYDSYLKLVTEQFQEREKHTILTLAKQENWSLQKITDELNRLTVSNVSDRKEIKHTLAKMLEEPWQPKQAEERTLKTGIQTVDQMTGGFADGELIVVAARPSVGKTDYVNNLVIRASQQGYKSIFFSLEMEEEKITRRLVGTVGNINRFQLKDPHQYLSDKTKDRWTTIIGETSNIDLVVYDKPRQQVSEIKDKVRKERLDNPDAKILVAVDYLTLITSEEFKPGMEVKMFTYIAEELKAIAKEFKVVMVALSQLSRDCEKRENKRPMSSDIRESGGIEQVANTIIGLYRQSLYYPCDNVIDDQCMEWILLKVREGSIGTVYVDYNRQTGIMRQGQEPSYAQRG